MSYDYSSTAARQEFAKRLAEVCSDKGVKEHGRQRHIAGLLKISQPAVGKWFNGESFPDLDNMVQLAEWGEVSLDWLMTGRGAKKRAPNLDKHFWILEALEDMGDARTQATLDFYGYQIQNSAGVIASDKIARYMTMIDEFKRDMDQKKKGKDD